MAGEWMSPEQRRRMKLQEERKTPLAQRVYVNGRRGDAERPRKKRPRRDEEEKVRPVTHEERLHWKHQEQNKLLRLAELYPEDRALYLAAAQRAQGEAEAIERLIARDKQSHTGVHNAGH